MKWRVLEVLRKQEGDWVSHAEVLAAASVSATFAGQAVAELEREGYRIERDETLGFRLKGHEDCLIPYELSRGLDTAVVGRAIFVHDSVDSTNDVAWQEALSGAEDGTIVLAEEQRTGRGRMGRRWLAPPRRAVLMSVVLRPELSVQDSNLLTVMSSVAVAQAIREHFLLHARIRWPNDITIKDRKVAGILVEGRSLATGTAFVVGIGLNVNTSPEDFPVGIRPAATSLAIEKGVLLDRIEVARGLMVALDRWYRDLRYGDYGRIARSWRHFSSTMAERVTLLENGREYHGRVLDLSLEEGLIVRLDEGVTRIFHPSTVSLKRQTADNRDEGLHPAEGSVQ